MTYKSASPAPPLLAWACLTSFVCFRFPYCSFVPLHCCTPWGAHYHQGLKRTKIPPQRVKTSKGHCSRPSNYIEVSLSEIKSEFQCAGLVQVLPILNDFNKNTIFNKRKHGARHAQARSGGAGEADL